MTTGLGLYALKPWYAEQLAPVADRLAARRVHPDAVSLAGVASGAAAGVALATLRPGPLAALVVGSALAARLACANLDGTLARRRGRGAVSSPTRGSVLNEVGDRMAELAALAGLWFTAPHPLVLLAALAMSAPSWVALAGAAAGAPRRQGGPVGKTERAALLVAVAATGWCSAGLALLAAGSALTAGRRLWPLVRSPR